MRATQVYSDRHHVCVSHNKVLPRHMNDSRPQRRNWSMQAWDEHEHQCSNAEALLAALANGQRHWASGSHIESVHSNFELVVIAA